MRHSPMLGSPSNRRLRARSLIALALFFPFLLVLLSAVTKTIQAYEQAERFVGTDNKVVEKIGTVTKTDLKFWNGFGFTGSQAHFSIEATGERGVVVVDVRLRSAGETWNVEAAHIR